jgi:predicted HTH transcriptional regulator
MQQNLKKLLSKKESENLDFKQTITSLYKIAKTITSFANTSGGFIGVGIKDDRTITGIDPEEEKYMLLEAANQYCDPPVEVSFEELENPDDQKVVLVVEVKESTQKPHYAKDKNGDWIVYIRQNDKCLPAGKNTIQLMKKGIKKDLPASLSPLEQSLLLYLNKTEKITLKQFMKLVNISKRRANRILTELSLKNLIREHTHEKEAYYTL